jgi:hypothetical protein
MMQTEGVLIQRSDCMKQKVKYADGRIIDVGALNRLGLGGAGTQQRTAIPPRRNAPRKIRYGRPNCRPRGKRTHGRQKRYLP